MITISVVVSTYNRSVKLARLLGSLETAAREARDESVEIVVADNRSSDDTRAVVERIAATSTSAVRYVFEGRPGKSFGLNAGLGVAQGELIALTDDDIVVSRDWFSSIRREFQPGSHDTVVGGRVELYDESDLPIAVRRSSTRARFSLDTFAPNDIPVLGANLVLHRKVLDRVGLFDTRLGPGTGLVAEDLDYLYRVLRTGYTITYSPDMVVFHGHDRKSDEDLASVSGPYFRGRGAFYGKYLARLDRHVARYAWWELHALLGKGLTPGRPAPDRRRALNDASSLLRGGWLYLRRG